MSASMVFIRCRSCSSQFPSPVQFPAGGQVSLRGNLVRCPQCGRMVPFENRDVIHVPVRKGSSPGAN